VAILDTNCDPDEVTYPIPGNDDAIRAIRLLTNKIADAAQEGRGIYQQKLTESHLAGETEGMTVGGAANLGAYDDGLDDEEEEEE